jgi:hypothetical protein
MARCRMPSNSLLEHLWPSRSGPSASQERRMALLQVGIAFAIALASGPEIFAAIEMTTLLEMLGASLFLSAFAAGARLAVENLWRSICNILFPAAQIAVIRSDVAVLARAQALIFCAVNAAWWLAGSLVVGLSLHSIMQVAMGSAWI